ncbi:glycosyltransferase [Iningainema tapete]|uniref:Glycosyltransferase family 2 protein n=1 Tax=Iningainema tapete BLCC-T55 TaxID=2748662 RepID=A0A8J7CBK9_9CYAN|nr:glycosyltransferase [Iningainema tapete]MBD2778471.1 glycosyltransferase family 2 protein [Iningainema tapete BLCC-T55]
MNVVSRVQFPQTSETSDLYIRCPADISIDENAGDRQITLPQGSTISLNTYFNSIYEKFYTKYTSLKSLYYLLKLEGDFEVSTYREYETNSKELICTQTIKDCLLSQPVKIILPELRNGKDAGRIYLEITCLSQQGLFTQGLVATEQKKHQDVYLGIITCTFKKEAYVKKTVNTILQDSLLREKQLKIFVVDNGKTLKESDFQEDRVRLIPNRNLGGSGGFTKGLISALPENFTHFLFMDDDIELDSEVVYKLFSLYEYAQEDFAVAGSMLDLYQKHILYEAGVLYNKYLDHQGNIRHRPFALTSLKNNLELQSPTSLNLLLVEQNVDFGGFYFFSCSKSVVESVGLPLPFFIKIDDLEFSLRTKEHLKNGIVAFPSLGVWHEPFYAKKPIWDLYYANRNKLITDAIHDYIKYFSAVKTFTKSIIFHLLLFDYNTALMFIKGFEDYMEGPSLLRSNDPVTLHGKICELSKKHKTQTILNNSTSINENYQITKTGKLQKVLSVLTLNGHLLPKFLIKDETAIIRYGSKITEQDSVCKGFAKKRIIFIMNKNSQYYQNELDQQVGINIFIDWVKFVIRSSVRWSNVSAEWKKATPEFTSIQFWQNYLEPVDKTEPQRPNYVKPGEAI